MSTQNCNKPNYGLSSWNYGSFHPSNPYHNKQANAACADNKTTMQRCQSASGFNQHGKRRLNPDEKIVKDEYLKVMKDNKTIQNAAKARKNPNRLPSSSGVVRSSEEGNSFVMRDSLNSGDSQILKKNLKYQLTFEEWAIMKNKQDEILQRVKVIKESEDKKFELFNKKIDKNFEKVK
jgi:hypothetical protein